MSIEQAFQKVEKFGRKPAEYLAFAVAVDIIFLAILPGIMYTNLVSGELWGQYPHLWGMFPRFSTGDYFFRKEADP